MKLRYPLMKPEVGAETLREVEKVLESGWLALGPCAKRFEDAVKSYVGAKYAVAVNSCTSALYLCLRSLGIRGEVIVPDFTFPATASAVLEAGARPKIVDVEEESMGIDPGEVERAISGETQAIIPVHPFGCSVDMDPLLGIARERGIWVIEDAATALGSKYKGRFAGNLADAGCYSFHPRKIITTGEGGMIVLNDEEWYEKLVMLRNYGRSRDGAFRTHSLNFMMSDVLAAIGSAQMGRIEEVIERRRRLAEAYHEIIGDLLPFARPLRERPGDRSTYQSYVVNLAKRELMKHQELIIEKMRRHEIETQIGTYALSLEPAYKQYVSGPIRVSSKLRYLTLTLPLYGSMEVSDLEYIVRCLSAEINELLR